MKKLIYIGNSRITIKWKFPTPTIWARKLYPQIEDTHNVVQTERLDPSHAGSPRNTDADPDLPSMRTNPSFVS